MQHRKTVKNNNRSKISKSNFVRAAHFFSYISLPLFCTTTTWNFQKLLKYTFYGGNVVCVPVHLFFTAAHFHLALVAASISHFVNAATNVSCCSSNKICLLCFLSLGINPCRPFYLWASLAFDETEHNSSYINWSLYYLVPEFRVDWKLLKLSNMGAKVSKYWPYVY